MKKGESPAPDATDEISVVIATLNRAEQRLVELTAGEIDSVADSEGRTFLLRRAQEQTRHSEAIRQAAILNALPAHIALLDNNGLIISVNESWRQFAVANVLRCPGYAVGVNYLEICDNARGECSAEARQVAEGIRAVLGGTEKSFSIEYPCHSITEQRWFLLMVTPLADDHPNGAVVMHLNITERRRSETASMRLAAIVEFSDDAIVGKDLNRIITSWNLGATKIFGYTASEMVGTSITRLIPPGREDEENRILGRVVRGESVAHFETLRQTRDGRLIDVSITASPIKDGAGNVIGVSKVMRDVTGRKHTENALRESDEKFHQLADNLSDVFWITSPDLKKMHYISPGYERIWGRSTDSLYADSHQWMEAIVPEDRDHVTAIFAQLMGSEPKVSVEYRIARPDAAVRWVHDRGFQVRDGDGKIIRLAGIVADITERKRAEAELHRQQTELRVLFDLMPAMIWFKDTNNKILRVNQRAAQTAGKTVDEIEGKTTLEIYPMEADKFYADDLEVIRSGSPKLGIVESILDRKKNELWVQTDKVPVRDFNGNVIGLVVMAQDITERKRSEEALRTSEIQLRQSQKMDAIGQLAGGVAHDFNNLLTVILGRAELLEQRSDLAEPVRRSVNLIHQTGMRAAVLTRQLLQFSRQQILQTQVLDVNVLVSGMQELLRRLISEDINLVLKFNSKAVNVKADAGQIEQVIMNLVINARDAMPNGGNVTIETANVELDAAYCKSHEGANPGPHVMLAVSDSGCGMPEAIRARIFEPFFTTKEKGKGTGLGLSTVYGIVKQAGGSIYVYSEVNHGTIFKVYLPEIMERVTSKISSSALLHVHGGGETILLAEDEDGIRELLNDILSERGYTVLQAKNGEHAVKCSESHNGEIQLLLTDVVMPKMNGKDVAQNILRSRPDLKVIYMSGYTSDAIVSRGILDEGIEFLEKPFTPTSVATKVREVLDRPAML